MKIVQVSALDTTMNGLLRELNTTIRNNGHKLICVCSNGPKVDHLKREGFDVRPINIDRKISPLNNIKSIIKMYKLFRSEKPDIVHVHTPVASILGRIAAKMAGVPNIVYTAHGFYFHENMSKSKYKLFHTIEKVCARLCTDYIFTQSQEDGELAIKDKFLPRNNITTIGNGVDVFGKFNPRKITEDNLLRLRNELRVNKNDVVVTFIGRLVKEKGILDLLNAFNNLEKSNIKLLVVGSTAISERDQETKKLLEKYNKENVVFTGYRTDVQVLLGITDIFCLPSYREGMPRSIIEAMSMECAVIATNIRGSREEVVEGETGFLIPLKSPEKIKNKIIELANDSVLLGKMKYKGRERACKLYNEKEVVKIQMKKFEEMTEDTRLIKAL